MRTIAHISDLHFGRVDSAVVPALARSLIAADPDIIVVSGDLTQRARRREFLEAREFLDALPQPQIVVPGNHDVPLYNMISRSLTPLLRYRIYITNDLEPFYADPEVAVVGVNTARAVTFKNGRINQWQVARACARFVSCGENVTRIVVTHHPFDLDENRRGSIVGRARMAMAGFAQCGVDLILSGHMHIGRTANTAVRYPFAGQTALLIEAGTATSSRRRGGELNAWNLIRIDRPWVAVERLAWDPDRGAFAVAATERFHLAPEESAGAAGRTGAAAS